MKIVGIAAATALAMWLPFAHAETDNESGVEITDPYAKDKDSSPWAMSMKDISVFGGRVIRGDATILSGKEYKGFDTYTPFQMDRTNIIKGYASTEVGIGCDGINLGGIVEGQMNQYQDLVEELVKEAPTLAIMYLAYSQPAVKAVIDELNVVSQFGIDLSNFTCSGVRAMADKAREEKLEAMAEARCTAENGYKDPECMADDQLQSGVAKIMKDTKAKMSERTGAWLGNASAATGGLVGFSHKVDGQETVPKPKEKEEEKNTNKGSITSREEACKKIDADGLRAMILSSSGMSCDDIDKYAGLVPDYKIDDKGQPAVVPRHITARKLMTDLVVQHEKWIYQILETPEREFIKHEAYRAIFNRTGIAITINQHRQLNLAMTKKPVQAIGMIRNLAQLIALKDLNLITGRIEIGVLTGMQNQIDDKLMSDLRRNQYNTAIETLRAEVEGIQREISFDMKRNEIL